MRNTFALCVLLLRFELYGLINAGPLQPFVRDYGSLFGIRPLSMAITVLRIMKFGLFAVFGFIVVYWNVAVNLQSGFCGDGKTERGENNGK